MTGRYCPRHARLPPRDPGREVVIGALLFIAFLAGVAMIVAPVAT